MRKFTCEMCKNEYTTETAVNDLQEEFETNYGESLQETEDKVVSICDECYEKLEPFINEIAVLLAKDILKNKLPDNLKDAQEVLKRGKEVLKKRGIDDEK